ncbi:MAG: DUF2797 domain-containing protein [Pseudonocardiaceae bacterium]
MSTNSDLLCLGVDWSRPAEPSLRLANLGSTAPSYLLPLNGLIGFRITDSSTRYCAGWFDLTGDEPCHVNCESWERISSGKQCRRCQFKEGFLSAHQAHRGAAQLPDNVRTYLTQPHWLYLDIFADGSSKVGTVAESRLASRLAEQGAVAAYYVARANDGIRIREAEAAVSTQLRLRQTLSTKRKLEALQSKVDTVGLCDRLEALVKKVQPFLLSVAESGAIEVPDTPARWRLPSAAVTAFEEAPLIIYPSQLSSGDHSLYMHGVTGPIGVFAINNEPNPQLYAGNLANLHGMLLAFGDFHSTVEAAQPSLF